MTVGLLQLRLRIPENQSLKGKRQILLGLKTRLRQKFNISLAETDGQDKWQAATLAAACVGTDRAGVNRVLDQVADVVERERGVELVDIQLEFL